MSLETEGFEQVDECGGVAKLQKEVRTPMSTDNGYDYEENSITIYQIDSGYLKVALISTMGWRVTEYDEDGDLEQIHSNYYETEQEAHEKAKEVVTNDS